MRFRAQMNSVDRLVSWLNPIAGRNRALARIQMQALTGGYTGAKKDKAATAQWSAMVDSSPDFDTLPDLPILRARARDLVRNDPIAQSAIATKAANVIGTGHVVRPEVDADRLGITPEEALAWEEKALDIWTEWSSSPDCDLTRSQPFAELEDLAYRSRLLSGDVFALRRFRPRPGRLLASCIQMIEADRLSNPQWAPDGDRMAGGVELDEDGAPVAYHFADRYALDRKPGVTATWTRVPARDAAGRPLVLHIHGTKWRPDMTRYAPMLAPVIESLKQRSRYTEAELMAAVVSACFAIGMESPEGDLAAGLANGQSTPAGQPISITDPGKIFDLMPGEKLQSFAPGRPNPQFTPFVDAIAREIGAGTDLPQEILMKQFQASYSASRAAMEMAWMFFRTDRAMQIAQFNTPIYEDVIAEAVARGLLKAPGFFNDPLRRQAWLGAVWMGPARPTIDPVKDANADKIYLDMGVTSLTRIAAERFGVDYRTVQRRREQDGSDERQEAAAAPAGGAQPDPEDAADAETDLEKQ